MKGKYKVVVKNNRLHYEFEIKRNITIIQGDSATGKTTLISMLRQADNLGVSSGVTVSCKVPCKVLEGKYWENILQSENENIFFIDEENMFIKSEEFAKKVKKSNNYFVIITRENLYNLPYSVEEIYGLYSSGKYQNTKRVYQQLYNIYSNMDKFPVEPKEIIVEDSNSGYEFFKAVCDENNIICKSAGGKTKIFDELSKTLGEKVCVIADGAAIGPEMDRIFKIVSTSKDISLYLPESFEWIVLTSGLIDSKEIRDILNSPEEYIESEQYFSWERYFTDLLIKITENSYLKYKKNKLNKVYLHKKNKESILKVIEGIKMHEH